MLETNAHLKPRPCHPHVRQSLRPDGHLGILFPTTNQVSRTLKALRDEGFYITELAENLLRNFRLNPEHPRPHDTMVGHTGYLIFARRAREAPAPAGNS